MVTRAYFILLTVIRLVRAGSAVFEVTVVRGRTCDVISRRDGESGNTEAPKGSDLSRGGGARWMSPLAVPAVDVPGGCARWLWLDVPAGKGKANTKESEHETSSGRAQGIGRSNSRRLPPCYSSAKTWWWGKSQEVFASGTVCAGADHCGECLAPGAWRLERGHRHSRPGSPVSVTARERFRRCV